MLLPHPRSVRVFQKEGNGELPTKLHQLHPKIGSCTNSTHKLAWLLPSLTFFLIFFDSPGFPLGNYLVLTGGVIAFEKEAQIGTMPTDLIPPSLMRSRSLILTSGSKSYVFLLTVTHLLFLNTQKYIESLGIHRHILR